EHLEEAAQIERGGEHPAPRRAEVEPVVAVPTPVRLTCPDGAPRSGNREIAPGDAVRQAVLQLETRTVHAQGLEELRLQEPGQGTAIHPLDDRSQRSDPHALILDASARREVQGEAADPADKL